MRRSLSRADWLLMPEPEEPQRGYGEAAPWLLCGSFVAGAGLFATEGDALQSLTLILLGTMLLLYGAMYALPTHRRRAVLGLRISSSLLGFAAILCGVLGLSIDASSPLVPILLALLVPVYFIYLYRSRRRTRRS